MKHIWYNLTHYTRLTPIIYLVSIPIYLPMLSYFISWASYIIAPINGQKFNSSLWWHQNGPSTFCCALGVALLANPLLFLISPKFRQVWRKP